MASIEVTNEVVRVRLSSWERFGALHGDLTFPRSSVVAADAVPDIVDQVRGVRAPGFGWPSHALVGTWRGRGYRDFVSVYRAQPQGVVVQLKAEAFDRLLLSCPEPKSVVAALYA
ncbi:MAG: hypothetical protein ABWZ26_00170 [Candidatus Nanopelagicales bacterium]